MEKLGKYKVLGELGHGAMGVVYRARDPIINRLVALKTITTGVADYANLLQRFYREAQSAGGLQHPNIVTIYDMGDEGGIPYIAMELIEGESLEQIISRRLALPLTLKLTYALQACRAFDYAHKRGIIHRDIKPGNVMVNTDGVVKVVDFGIARVMEGSKTVTGMLVGTFAYMSPEQYHGEHADERSDVWSFGVLLYELLAFQRPFTGDTPASLMYSICQLEPPALHGLVPDCPEELERVVRKVLSKSAAERYQSMEDLLLELDPICKSLQSETVSKLIEEGSQLADSGDFSQARDLLRQALKFDSTNLKARGLLDVVNAELKRILVRPKAEEHVAKGQALLDEKRVREAQTEAEAALQLDSNFAPAHELRERVQQEVERIRLVAEWIQASEQRLAEGNPEEAETLLAKVLQCEPANQEARRLQQQATKEKAERQRRQQLSEWKQQARALWSHQKYTECIDLLMHLEKEFPGDAEALSLLETAREDQAEQQKRQSLEKARNLLAAGKHEESKALLAELQKRFPGESEIPKLLDEIREDQANQRRLSGLAEARSHLAATRYDQCISLLNTLQKEFPGETEVRRLLETAREERAAQVKQQGVTKFHQLLAGSRHEECNALLTELQAQFPDDKEIPGLFEAVREDQAQQQKVRGLSEARNLLASGNYERSLAMLVELQKEFSGDDEIVKLVEAVRRSQAEQKRLQSLAESRKLLASRRYDESIALLLKLQTEFSGDAEIAKLLETVRQNQAEQRRLEGLAEARKLLAAGRYDDCVALTGHLLKEFPKQEEIARLLEKAEAERATQQKERRLAEARDHLAAQRFEDALSVLADLRTAYPKDAAVQKLRVLVQHEQQEKLRFDRLQRELEALRNLVAERKYARVLAGAAKLLEDFPGDADLERLVEFAKTQQAQIERDSLLQKTLAHTKGLFDSKRFPEAVQAAKEGLKTFPAHPELMHLAEQAEIEQRKLETRQSIERRIKEIKVKINREKFSEAIELAKATIASLGPDTDVTQLLNSAEVEYHERERRREEERELAAIRGFMEAGNIPEAARNLTEAITTRSLDAFDPRVQRMADEIEAAKARANSPADAQTPPAISKEYAFRQSSPHAITPPVPEKDSPAQGIAIQGSTAGTTPSAEPRVPPPAPVTEVREAASTIDLAQPNIPVAENPLARAAATGLQKPEVAKPLNDLAATTILPPGRPSAAHAGVSTIDRAAATQREPARPAAWKTTARFIALAMFLIAAIWSGFHLLTPTRPKKASSATTPSIQPAVNPLEVKQREAIDTADKQVAANDLEGALRTLEQSASLNGPLAAEIQKKQAQIDEALKDADLRQLRQKEEQLWQRAKEEVSAANFVAGREDLRQILALGAGGLRKEDARQYLTRTIPQREQEEKAFSQARQAAQRSDPASLQSASDLLGRVIGFDGPRKGEAEQLHRDVQKRLVDLYASHARRDLKTGNFSSARQDASQIPLAGGDSAPVLSEIDQAEQARLDQLKGQLDQLKKSDDDTSVKLLGDLQRQFQGLADGGGPLGEEARNLANSIPGAVRDVQTRAADKRAEIAYQQIVQLYQQSSAANDRKGLEAARNGFQPIAQGGGPHASDAQGYLNQIAGKLAALNVPTPAPPAEPSSADDASVRAVVQAYATAFEQRDADALRRTWPGMANNLYGKYKKSFDSASSIRMQVQDERVEIGSDGASATVTATVVQDFTPKGQKTLTNRAQTVFNLVKLNGAWVIASVR